jgi:hypothetical protein
VTLRKREKMSTPVFFCFFTGDNKIAPFMLATSSTLEGVKDTVKEIIVEPLVDTYHDEDEDSSSVPYEVMDIPYTHITTYMLSKQQYNRLFNEPNKHYRGYYNNKTAMVHIFMSETPHVNLFSVMKSIQMT